MENNNEFVNKKLHCKWGWQKKCDEYENCLFKFKFLILIPIIFSIGLAFILFIIGGWEFLEFLYSLLFQDDFSPEQIDIKVLSITDTFLFGMVMIIFALGSYNLFISKFDNVSKDHVESKTADHVESETADHVESETALPEWLKFSSFSELKELFIKVIILILSILFLENLIELGNEIKLGNLIKSGNEIKLGNIIYLSLYPISVLLFSWSIYLISNNKESKKDDVIVIL